MPDPAPSFAIAAHGVFSDGPAQALRDFLVERGARVMTIFHPLDAYEGRRHLVALYERGERISERSIRLPVRPPFSFPLDPLVPLKTPPVDAWFGFDPLECARGLVARRFGRAHKVVLWSVDFTPDRFGPGLATRLYDRVDKFCCTHSDARVELSEAARDARNCRHSLPLDATPTQIVPMGTWLARTPTTTPDGAAKRRIAFLGHLVEGKGVELLLDALALLDVAADLVGGGPLEAWVRRRVLQLGLSERVHVHGFVSDHRDVERILAESSLAVAPYSQAEASHTRWADPGKLKAYLAAGLPIVMTAVPPNAAELAREAGAEIVPEDAAALATALERGLASEPEWRARREAALTYARRFDWNELLGTAVGNLGLNVS